MEASTKDTFIASLHRCLQSAGFTADFYERFVGMSPTVGAKFERTDFSEQRQKLARSLAVIGSAVKGNLAGLRELAERAETHSRRHLDVKPDLYELWIAAMLSTASEHDPEWNAAVELAWFTSLETVVSYMIKRY